MVRHTAVGLTEKKASFCYGMSKMSVINEMGFKGINPYLKMQFVEFLEYIGRVADIKYKESNDLALY